MSKLIPVYKNGKVAAYIFDCPGCGDSHEVTVHPNKNEQGASWLFNGDCDKPTFSPNINARVNRSALGLPDRVCHSWVVDGAIMFVADSTHKLAGKKVDLPDQEVDNHAFYR